MKINRDSLLEALKGGTGQRASGMTKRTLARALGITGDARRELRQILSELTADGTIVCDAKKVYTLAGTLPNVMVLDIERIDEHGDVIAVPVKWDKDTPPPTIIIKQKTGRKNRGHRHSNQISVGDRALCRLKTTEQGITATVIKKLGDGPNHEVGFVVKGGRGLRIRPAKKGSRYDYIPERGAKINDLDIVLFELSNARHKGERSARIIKTLGNAKHGKAASLISLLEHNIPVGFSDKELTDA